MFLEPGKKFLIPFLTDANAIENIDVAPLNENRICTSALLVNFNMGHSRWKKVRHAATSSNSILVHCNKGQKRSFPEEDHRVITLHSYFKELLSLGKVQAIRFVQTVAVDGSTDLVT